MIIYRPYEKNTIWREKMKKKFLTLAMAAVMAIGLISNPDVEAKAGTLDDMITSATSAIKSKGFELTAEGVKVTFDAEMTTNFAWDSPQFAVYTAEDDTAANVVTDVANANCYFVGRSDNFASDSAGNRWGLDNLYIKNANTYVFFGEYTKTENVTLEMSYTMTARLVGDVAFVEFSGDTFTSYSMVKVDTTKKNYVSVIANYCDITNISYEALSEKAETTSLDGITSTGYGTALTDAVEITDVPTYLSCTTTAGGTENYHGPCVFVYNGEKQCAAICCDTRLNTIEGYSPTLTASFGGDWALWNDRLAEGAGTGVIAWVDGTDVVVIFGTNTFGSKVVIPGINAEDGVSLKMSVDNATLSNIKVVKEVEVVEEPSTDAPTQAPSTDDTQAPTTVPSANGKDPEVVTTAPSGEKDTTAAEKDTTAAVGEKDTTAAGQKDTTAAGEKDTTAEQQTTTVDSTNIAVSDEEAAKLEDSAKVEGDKLDKDVALKVSKVEDKVVEAVKEAAKEVLKDKVYAAVDLKLVKGTEVVQANGDVKVTINVPEKVKNAKVVEVFRLDADKLVSLGKADVKDGKISFTTNHFSTYVFADVTPAATDSEPGGDTAPVMMLLAIAAVAGAAVVASKKKNVTE